MTILIIVVVFITCQIIAISRFEPQDRNTQVTIILACLMFIAMIAVLHDEISILEHKNEQLTEQLDSHYLNCE